MARLINAFTFDERVGARVAALSGDDLAELFGPPPEPPSSSSLVDAHGLTAENYAALYDQLGLPPAGGASDPYAKRRSIIDRTPDWDHWLRACNARADRPCAAAAFDAMTVMRKANRKITTMTQRAANKAITIKPPNRSRIMEALVVLGLTTLKEKVAARRDEPTRGQAGDARAIEVKPARRGRREVTAA